MVDKETVAEYLARPRSFTFVNMECPDDVGECPIYGQICAISYTAYFVDGTEFESSFVGLANNGWCLCIIFKVSCCCAQQKRWIVAGTATTVLFSTGDQWWSDEQQLNAHPAIYVQV